MNNSEDKSSPEKNIADGFLPETLAAFELSGNDKTPKWSETDMDIFQPTSYYFEDELFGFQRYSSKYKSELCKAYEVHGKCKYGQFCQFAHGYEDLKNSFKSTRYKTELCINYHNTGVCEYGRKCLFIHSGSHDEIELSRKIRELASRKLTNFSS